MPYHYEKTLILGKESGLFSSILPEEIPDYITIGVFEHFLEHAILSEALLEARQAADTVLSRMPSKVPDDFLLNYLREQ